MSEFTQLSTNYPNLEIYLCHVPTSMMIAELATKRPPAIVEALNSNEWRHASSTKIFTKPIDIFMMVINGKMTWLKNENNPSHCMKCLNVYCGQAISLNLQYEFHCRCYFCSTYPQIGLVEPIFSDMDEKLRLH